MEDKKSVTRGVITRIIGSVVDIYFVSGVLPDINDAVEVRLGNKTIVMEVEQHLGNRQVRCVSLLSTDGLSRGM